jgi:hypothetical protein
MLTGAGPRERAPFFNDVIFAYRTEPVQKYRGGGSIGASNNRAEVSSPPYPGPIRPVRKGA